MLDFGSQTPLRSQTLWHAVAHGVSAGEPPTLSFVTPSAPYVSIGYHRRLKEIDLDSCRSHGLPVFRRMVGGGPVYLDRNQLFFQISLPSELVPAFGPRAMRYLLTPAVEAFNDVGVPATFDERGDISVGEAKISGIAGGQIEGCSLAVGNLVHAFDYDAMAMVLGVAEEPLYTELVRMMRTYFHPTPVDQDAFKAALIARYASAFDLEPGSGLLSDHERAQLSELDARFTDPGWLSGPDRADPPARQIKIRSGVWVFSALHQDTRVTGSVIGERFERLHVEDPLSDGQVAAIEAALAGERIDEMEDVLAPFGATGERVVAAISRIDGRNL